MNRALLILALGLVACKGTTTVIVRASVPDVNGVAAPASDLQLVALPYNRDSVIEAMIARAPTRPNTQLLDSAFAEFRAPFAAFSSASYAVQALQDSMRDAAGRTPAREQALTARRAEVERLRPAIDAARIRLALRSDSARKVIRAWEDIAFAGYDTIAKPLTRFHDPVADTTDAVGLGSFELKPGTWWITAQAWDAADPNADWYWNVKVEGDTVVLSPANARRKPRY